MVEGVQQGPVLVGTFFRCSRFTWSLRFRLPHLRGYALSLPLAHYSHRRPHPVQPPGWKVPCGYPHSTRLSVTVMSHW